MVANNWPLPCGAGLGLRRELIEQLCASPQSVDFLELAPENWIKTTAPLKRQLAELAERHPITCHGLSLSLGSPDPLDGHLLTAISQFNREYGVAYYTEHLSYCSAGGHFYDLAPIPFTEEAVVYTAKRIRKVQDTLGERIGVENISYYAAPGQHLNDAMDEASFLLAVTQEADCDLLLDINNIYVNSINHGYNASDFLACLGTAPVRYLHIAGHFDEAEDLKIDSHGSDVIDPVWQLLEQAYRQFGNLPTLLERDFNIPSLEVLSRELDIIRAHQAQSTIPVAAAQ
ncbi:MAG: DUF692 domain-containing protein [Porticoccaceae bacterium]